MERNNFNKVYLNIINEAKFKSKKWKYFDTFKDVEEYIKEKHVIERYPKRYKERLGKFLEISFILNKLVDEFLVRNLFIEEIKRKDHLQGFTVHLLKSDIWISGMIQNDIDESKYRVYLSTFLPPEDTKFNRYDIRFDLDI